MTSFVPMNRRRYDRMVRLLARGLTQDEVAERLGVVQSAVSYRVKHGFKEPAAARSNNRISGRTAERVLDLHALGLNNGAIARAVRRSNSGVWWFLEKRGLRSPLATRGGK